MDIVNGLVGLLGLNQQELDERQRRQDDFTDDESEEEDSDVESHPKKKQQRTTDEILDRIIGSCADFGELYQRKYGNLTRTCSDHHHRSSLTTTTRYPSRSRKNNHNNNRRNSRERPNGRTTHNHHHEMQQQQQHRQEPFSLGAGIEIPAHFNNDDVSAVTGITLDEMAQRAAMQANRRNRMILEQHQEEEDKHNNTTTTNKNKNKPSSLDDHENSMRRNINDSFPRNPPSPTGTSTSSSIGKELDDTLRELDNDMSRNNNNNNKLSSRPPSPQELSTYDSYHILTTVSSSTTEFESIWKSDHEALSPPKVPPKNNNVPKEWETPTSSTLENIEEGHAKYKIRPPPGWTPRKTKLIDRMEI